MGRINTASRFAGCWVLCAALLSAQPARAESRASNRFANPSFELGGDGWQLDKAGGTEAKIAVEQGDSGAGRHCVRMRVGRVEDWGVQFGQYMDSAPPGSTWTFAVLARSVGRPATARLQIERHAKPWDRVAASEPLQLATDRWTELRLTFRVDGPFPEGWFAYVHCAEPGQEYLFDMFRLVEGEYVPYQQLAAKEHRAAAVVVFDTVQPIPDGTTTEGLTGHSGWIQIPEDDTEHGFQGDAVLTNDRLALVLRRGASGVELYARNSNGPTLRAVLAPVAEGLSPGIRSLEIVENSASEAVVQARFGGPGAKSRAFRFGLGMGQPFVRTESDAADDWLAIEAPCRFVVLPDFFADDIVVDAGEIPVARAELPSENLLLHLIPGGESLLMTVSGTRDQDARVAIDGQGPERLVRRSEVAFGQQRQVWVAVLDTPGLWYHRDVSRGNADQVIRLDWTAPFAAQWRVDWRRADQLASSWEMIVQQPGGRFEKAGWFGSPTTIPEDRRRWTTVLGFFAYPCWLDGERRGHLQPLKKGDFLGPAVIYPIQRSRDTPLDAYTVVDVVRATLGVGPCEYILDVEGQGTTMKGRATCATRDALKAIYSAGQQRARRGEIEKILDEVVVFVKHIRGRIEEYHAFGEELAAYLEEQRQTHPELADYLAEMQSLARAIDAAYQRRKESIRTPQYVVDLTETFRQTVLDDEGPDALAKCTAITEAIVKVGGNQDELVGESRQAVKVLRQRAGLAMAVDPRSADVSKEIRARTQRVLRNAASYEAPQH